MASRKFILSAILISSLFLLSFPVAPDGPTCSKESPSMCGLISNVGMLAGGAFMFVSGIVNLSFVIKNSFQPVTKIVVELPNGEIKKGILTHKGKANRPVKDGDKVRITCKKSLTSTPNEEFKNCELEFSGFYPSSPCPKGTTCYGKIPGWNITVDEKGFPVEKSIIKIIEE